MIHIFKKGKSEDTLILLHGTGGDESDLLDIGKTVFADANLLGIRGNVLENGMSRFFKRLSMGVFDLESYNSETIKLKIFIDEAVKKYNLNHEKLWILGYSNGANIAINLFVKHPNYFKGMALLHAMLIEEFDIKTTQNTKVLLTWGVNDPIISFNQTKKLEAVLSQLTNNFTSKGYTYGHSLSGEEISDIKNWFKENSKN